MSIAADLLEQAKGLLDSKRPENRGRPKQVDLRRSISTAYYSLFSLLVEEAATVMIGGGSKKKALRGYVSRAISHEAIRGVCKGFANRNPDDKIKSALADHGIPGDLVDIAITCHDLQVERHEADYNFIRNFTKEEAINAVEKAMEAHRKWKVIKDNEATKVFLTALVVYKLVQTSGATIRASQSSVRGQ